MIGPRGSLPLLIAVAGAMLVGIVAFAPMELARGGSPRAVGLAALLTLSLNVIALVGQTACVAFFVYEAEEVRTRVVPWLAAAGIGWLPVAGWLIWTLGLWQGPPLWTLRFLTVAGLPAIAALVGAAVLRRRA